MILALLTITILSVFVNIYCASKDKNVLIVIIDDLKPNLGFYGYKNALTPNFNALANRSFVFTNAFTQVAYFN